MSRRTHPGLLVAAVLIAAGPAFSESVYRDPDGQFSVTVPDDWTAQRWSLGVMFKHGRVLVNLLTHSERIEPEVMARVQVKLAVEGWKDVRSSGTTTGTVDGNPSATVVVMGNTEDGPRLNRFTCFTLGSKSYIFRSSVPPQEYSAAQPAIERLEQGFRAGTDRQAAPTDQPAPTPRRAAPASEPKAVWPPPPSQPEGGGGPSIFRDPQGRFQLRIPAGWDAGAAGNGARVSRGNSFVNVLVMDGTASAADVVDGLARQIGQQWSNFKEGHRGTWKLAGLPANFAIFTGVNPKGVPALMRIIAAGAQGRVYVVLMSVPQSDWENTRDDLQQIEEGLSVAGGPPPAAQSGQPPAAPAARDAPPPAEQGAPPAAPPRSARPPAAPRQAQPQQQAPPPAGRPFLGVACRNLTLMDLAASGATQGAVVGDIAPGSPAARAGIERNDIIVGIDRAAVTGGADVGRLIGARKPGDEVLIQLLRQGKPVRLKVVLGAQQ